MATPERIGHMNREVLRILAELLPNIKDPRVSGMTTVIRVDTTRDLSLCRVYVSTLEDDKKSLKQGLKSASGYLRRELGKILTLRHVPELEFIVDTSIEDGNRIFALLEETKHHA